MSSDYEFDTLENAGSGEIIRVTAGQALTIRTLVYLNADGMYYIADASAAATMPIVGITLHASAAGFPVTLLLRGYLGDPTVPPTWAWTTGSELYASNVAGTMGHATGTIAQQVGYAISATQIFFDPEVAAGAGFGGVTIRRNTGADIGTRPRLNLIEGVAAYLTVVPVDDAVGNEVDITFTPLGVGVRERPAAIQGPRNVINLIEGPNITIAAADNAGNQEVDVTITAAGGGAGLTEFTYIVVRDNGTYTVYDNNGTVVHGPSAGADAEVEINWAFTNGGAGAVVELEARTTFILDDSITFTAHNQVLQGGGRGTLIDGTALGAGEHAIEISGFDDCTIRELAIDTKGSTVVTHCIFIEDGADRFLIENVWIVDSDANGIHIEGTTISGGHIHGCFVLGADGAGIYIDMDAANYLLGLHISDCDITACGLSGINLQPSGGNRYTMIVNCLIYENDAEGIYMADGDRSTIDGCTLQGNATDGIEVNSSDHVTVSNNTCQSNIQHGIYFVASNNGIIEANVCEDNDHDDTATYDGINLTDTSLRNVISGNHCCENHRHGIYVEGITNSINGNYLNANDRYGIALYGGEGHIEGNYVYDNGQDTAGTYHGIFLGGAADWTSIVGNHCDDPGDTQEDGIYLSVGAANCSIVGNYCYNLLGDGIRLAGTNTKTLIEANYCFTNDENGIVIQDSTYCNVNGNHCSVNQHHGIFLHNVDNSSITSNSCVDNDRLDSGTYDGICANNESDNNMITANKCDGNDRYGISVAGVTNRVKENEFDGNTAGCFNDTGTDTQTAFIFCRVTDPNDNIGTHPAVRLEDNTDTHIYDQIFIPLEFQELVTVQVVVVSAADGNMVWTLDTNWGKLCTTEAYNEETDTDGGTEGLLISDLECVSIIAAFTGIAPGDLVGLDFMRNGDDGADTINDVVYYLGIRVRYV